MKDEREILTREIILQKLARSAKRSMIGAFIMLVLGALMLGMLHLMSRYASPSSSDLTVIAEIALDLAFVGACVFFFARGALRMHKARRGDFSIVEDFLLEVQDDRFSLREMLLTGSLISPSNYVHVFRFQSGKRAVISSGGNQTNTLDTTARISLPGDRFILVVYNDAPEKIVLLYSTKLYTYSQGNGTPSH